ncbi:30S ribosomal protein S4 [Candidatus Woesearchaeota archaeon]|nr:30S ribosomal protein S4 [Candidatus Woesearchaeota archaeon]
MGDPRRIRRKFLRPGHPWQKERIEQEKMLLREFGLRRKNEIWKHQTTLKKFAGQAKKLIAARGAQAETEKRQLMTKLASLGLLEQEADLDDVLSLDIRDILSRRLQTQVVEKGLARTHKQARQFITHRHIQVGDTIVTSPSHLIRISQENSISFIPRSALANDDHPERAPPAKETPTVEKDIEKVEKEAKKKVAKKEEKPKKEEKTKENKEEPVSEKKKTEPSQEKKEEKSDEKKEKASEDKQ